MLKQACAPSCDARGDQSSRHRLISNLLFTPPEEGDLNLAHDGIPKEKTFLVGEVMIDTLLRQLPIAEAQSPELLQSSTSRPRNKGWAHCIGLRRIAYPQEASPSVTVGVHILPLIISRAQLIGWSSCLAAKR